MSNINFIKICWVLISKYGKTNIKNNSELDLEEVKGTIVSKEKSTIYLNSDFAKYFQKHFWYTFNWLL